MGIKRKTPGALLAVVTTMAGIGVFAGSAPASTGGVPAAPGAGQPAPGGSGTRNPRPGAAAATATWFGPGMYGRRTACGQVLTRHLLGVANRRLPCGTLVRVGYRDRALVVPVLDRGPYTRGINWDLTAAAAHRLRLEGTGRVRARVVGHVPNGPLLGAPSAGAGAPSATTTPEEQPGSAATGGAAD